MRKKLTILFALLCASVMGWAYDLAPNTNFGSQDLQWQEIDGVTPPANVVNVQSHEGYDCLYITFSDAGFNRDYIGGGAVVYTNDGAQAWLQLKSFTNQYTDVLFYQTGSTTDVKWGLRIYNAAAGGGGSTPTPGPEPTPSVSPYCDYEVGHFGDPSADVNSFILLSIGSDGHGHTIVNIKQDADKNSNSFDYINVVGIKEIGSDVTTGGQTEMAIIFNTPTPDGDGNIKFTLLWSKVGDGGRWQLNDITVPANAICENADPFPGEHTYCKYSDKDLKKNNTYAALTWETNAVGDVVITLSDGEGASGTHFRNEGFEFDSNYDKSWKVYSGTKHSVCEPAIHFP